MQPVYVLPVPQFFTAPSRQRARDSNADEPVDLTLPPSSFSDPGEQASSTMEKSGYQTRLPPLRDVLRRAFGDVLPFSLPYTTSTWAGMDTSKWPSDLSLTLFLKSVPSSFMEVVIESIRWSSSSIVVLPSTFEGILKVHALDPTFRYHLLIEPTLPRTLIEVPDLRFVRGLCFTSLTVHPWVKIRSFSDGLSKGSREALRSISTMDQAYVSSFVCLRYCLSLENVSIDGSHRLSSLGWLKPLKNLRYLSIRRCLGVDHIPIESARILVQLHIEGSLLLNIRDLIFDKLIDLSLSACQTLMLTSQHQLPSITKITIIGRTSQLEKLRLRNLYAGCQILRGSAGLGER